MGNADSICFKFSAENKAICLALKGFWLGLLSSWLLTWAFPLFTLRLVSSLIVWLLALVPTFPMVRPPVQHYVTWANSQSVQRVAWILRQFLVRMTNNMMPCDTGALWHGYIIREKLNERQQIITELSNREESGQRHDSLLNFIFCFLIFSGP